MVKVSKNEAFWLRDHGFGKKIFMSGRTHTKKYYAEEDRRVMGALSKYRKEHITLLSK